MPSFPAAPAHTSPPNQRLYCAQQSEIALKEQCSDGIEAHVEIAVGGISGQKASLAAENSVFVIAGK